MGRIATSGHAGSAIVYPALKWYLEKALCFQENFLNLQVRPPTEFLLRLRETFQSLKPTSAIHLPHVSCTQPSKPAPMSLLGSKD
ncbi:hypothetical protein TNCV_4234441 [Trichonephila clavipes]|nr:hypothetical protein TNCV_4234441 [Trichonephila clavipes]